jgi:hypothetical protein
MSMYGIPDNPSLSTTSRIRVWWLHSIWGYKVLNHRRQPHTGWFGSMDFEDVYVLLPKETKH